MHFPIEKKGDIIIFHIEGELGMYNSPHLKEDLAELNDEGIKKIIIDLSNVPFIDSSGIGAMVKSAETLSKNNGKIVLCNLSGHIQKILNLTMIGNVLLIYEDVDEAIEAFQK